MATISASFRNDYSESRRYMIVDTGRDPSRPPVIFNDYLDPGQATDALAVYSAENIYGTITYQRSDGAPTVVGSVTNGSAISME